MQKFRLSATKDEKHWYQPNKASSSYMRTDHLINMYS